MFKNWIQIITTLFIMSCLMAISSIGIAQNNQVITVETEDGLKLQEQNVDQLQNEDLDLQQNRMIPSNLEIRHPLGRIWQQNEWPNPAINFIPDHPGTPAGDLYGNGMQNIIIYRYAFDERDDDLSTTTPKTLIYSENSSNEEPDFIIYDGLVPVGDINGSGIDNLYSQSNKILYEYDGSDFVTFPANIRSTNSQNRGDFDRDGKDDVFRIFNNYEFRVRYGGSDLNNLTEEVKYYIQDVLNGEDLFIPEIVNTLKHHFIHDDTSYLIFQGLQRFNENAGRYLLIVSINSDREMEFQQFFKYSDLLYSSGDMFHVNLEGDDFPSLVYVNHSEMNSTSSLITPSDDPDKLFNEERVPLDDRRIKKLGDLNGNGIMDLIVEEDNQSYYLGSIDSETNTVLVGDKIGDGLNFNSRIGSRVLYGDMTGDGMDNFRFRILPTDINDTPSSGFLFLTSTGGDILQEKVVFDLAKYQRRAAVYVYPIEDITGNGIEDFAIEYLVSNAPDELVIHEGGPNWATPYQVIQLPSENHSIRDVVGGHFTNSGRRDIAVMMDYYTGSQFEFVESEIWMLKGGASISETPDRIITAESYFPGLDEDSYSRFFTTMENVGDVNGSGYDDLLFGSWVGQGSIPDVPAGLYFGGPELSTNGPDVLFPFEDINLGGYGIGMTLKGLGDINNSGMDDFAIVNIIENYTQDIIDFRVPAGGRVHIYYGNEEGEFDTPDLTLRSDTTSLLNGNNMYLFGFNEIATGDFNNDGQKQLGIKPFRHFVAGDFSAGVPGIHIFDPASGSTQPEFLVSQQRNLYASSVHTIETELIGAMGRIQMTGVPGEAGDGLLTIGSSEFTNAVLYQNDGDGGLEPHTVYMAPNQRITMGTPGNSIALQFRTPLADYTGDGEMNFITVQRNDGNFRDSPVYMYEIEQNAVSTESVADIPEQFRLEQNYPNPFNPSSMISYQLPVMSSVRLEIFDMLGRKVTTLVNGRVEAGSHEVQFDASHLSSGIYLYRLQAGNFTQTKRMTLIK